MTGIRRRYIRVFTWVLGIFNPDTCVMHENQQINLIGPSWQADRFKLDILALSGEKEKELYDQECVYNNTITMNCDWLKDEFNCDNNDNDNNTLRKVPHPSNEGLALQARVKGS